MMSKFFSFEKMGNNEFVSQVKKVVVLSLQQQGRYQRTKYLEWIFSSGICKTVLSSLLKQIGFIVQLKHNQLVVTALMLTSSHLKRLFV